MEPWNGSFEDYRQSIIDEFEEAEVARTDKLTRANAKEAKKHARIVRADGSGVVGEADVPF